MLAAEELAFKDRFDILFEKSDSVDYNEVTLMK